MKEAHQKARESFLLWGVLQQCKRDTHSLAKHLLSRTYNNFWREIKDNLGKNNSTPAFIIDGVCGTEATCHIWQNHYHGLLNSSGDCSKKSNVLESLDTIEAVITIERKTPNDIPNAIKLISSLSQSAAIVLLIILPSRHLSETQIWHAQYSKN